MVESIENKIYNSIKRRKNGTIFFASDFVHFGNGQAANKALERLAKFPKIWIKHQISRKLSIFAEWNK